MSNTEESRENKESELSTLEITLSKVNDESVMAIANIFVKAIMNEDLIIDKTEAGFSIKIKELDYLEHIKDIDREEVCMLVASLIPAIYEIFENGDFEEPEIKEKKEKKKMLEIINNINQKTKDFIISFLHRYSHSLSQTKFEILTRKIKGKEMEINERFANLYLDYMKSEYEKERMVLSLSKFEIERLIKQLNKILSEIEGDDTE